jgi:hypothetical protein
VVTIGFPCSLQQALPLKKEDEKRTASSFLQDVHDLNFMSPITMLHQHSWEHREHETLCLGRYLLVSVNQ